MTYDKKKNKKVSEHFRIVEAPKNEDGIEVLLSDPELGSFPTKLLGFSYTHDEAGNAILYWKPKEKDRVILIHKTDHPDIDKSVAMITEWANMNGYTIEDIKTHSKELLEVLKKQKKRV